MGCMDPIYLEWVAGCPKGRVGQACFGCCPEQTLQTWRNTQLGRGQVRMLKSLQMGGNDCWRGMLKVLFGTLEVGPTVELLSLAPMVGNCLLGGFVRVLIQKGQRSGKWYMLPQCGQGHHRDERRAMLRWYRRNWVVVVGWIWQDRWRRITWSVRKLIIYFCQEWDTM